MTAICLVTDSTSDLPTDLVARYNIGVVPTILNIGDKSYRDGVDITRKEFYDLLPTLTELPHTAAPSAGEFEAMYTHCAAEANIISIHAAAALSGIYNSAHLAARKFGERVNVIDSGSLSMGLGWQVIAAAEAIAGGQPLPAVLDAIASVRRRIKVYALLDTLAYLRRSGRVSLMRAGLGSLLRIKPIIELHEGAVTTLSQERTYRRALKRLIDRVRALDPLQRLAIMHSNFASAAANLRDALADIAADPPPIVDVTTVIGTHVGPSAVGIAAVTAADGIVA